MIPRVLACLFLLILCRFYCIAEDFRPRLLEAIARGEKRFVISPGVYRLSPVGGGGELLNLHDLKDFEIVADGVTIVGTKLMRAISLHRCSGVTLTGLTVDYDPLPFTQGEIVAGAEDGNSIDVRIHVGYPRKHYARIDVVERQTRFRKKGMPFLWGTKAEMIAEDVVRVHLKGIANFAKPGDLASLSTGQETGAPHAISVDQCERIMFRNVTVHSAPGMGILEADGEGGSSFIGCKIVPGPPPSGATEARLLSTSWDAFQSKTIRRGPTVENCEIRDAGDDSWSVQSSDFVVLKSAGATAVLASRDEFTDGVQVGDRIRTGIKGVEHRIVSRRVVSRSEAQLAPEIGDKLSRAEAWSFWKVSPGCYVVELDRPSELKAGDSVYSPDRMGGGFVFRNNRIHSPGRVLLKAGGTMEGNMLDTPHGLVVCPELPGAAAAGIENLFIRNNTIRNGGWFCPAPWSSQAGIISVTATASSSALRSKAVFRNIQVEGNIVEGGSGPHLVFSSALDSRIQNNKFVSAHHDAPPNTGSAYGIRGSAVIWTKECSGLIIGGNVIENVGSHAGELNMVE